MKRSLPSEPASIDVFVTREHVAELEYESRAIEIVGASKSGDALLEGCYNLIASEISRGANAVIAANMVREIDQIQGEGFWNIVVQSKNSMQKFQCWIVPDVSGTHDSAYVGAG